MLKKHIFVSLILGAGLGFGFLREMVVGYYYGVGSDVDIFRMVTWAPYAMYQSLGTLIVPIYLASVVHFGKNSTEIVFRVSRLIAGQGIMLALVSTFFIGFYSESIYGLGFLVLVSFISWVGYLFSTVYFGSRVILQSEDKSFSVASTGLVFSAVFCALVPLNNNFDLIRSELSLFVSFAGALSISSAFIYWRSSKVKKKYSGLDENVVRLIEKSARWVFVLAVLGMLPRYVERLVLIELYIGAISLVDYAYSIYTALGVLCGSSLVLLRARKISKCGFDLLSPFRQLYSAKVELLVTIILSSIVYVFRFEISEILFFRGEISLENTIDISNYLGGVIISLPLMVANMINMQHLLASKAIRLLGVCLVAKVLMKYVVMQLCIDSGSFSVVWVSLLISELTMFFVLYINRCLLLRRA